ncbi:hypothetical protein [Micromonospora sp. WMMD998]|uniref:hypothetical protein n=1 Tax=Micromonospora sp. WMMD998 TaxID=3016092 RepID=UPI0032B412EC
MGVGRTDTDRPVHLTAADRPEATPPRRWRPRPVDALVVAGYLALAVLLTADQWRRPERLFHQAGDQMLFEWMLARAARTVTDGGNPLHSAALNAPDGVNLMANTSVLGLGVPLTPVTVAFGSQAAFLVAVALSLAGTATAWYALLARRLVRSRAAAAVGGLCCGFAPGMVAQAGAHLHMAAQFLVPVILALLFRPATDRVRRDGVLLGLVVAYQVFLGEEVLVFTALAAGVLAGAYALADRPAARRLAPAVARRAGLGALVAGVLLAYPLWFQFFGPGHYTGMPFHTVGYRLDLASFTAAARQTVAGDGHHAGLLSPNPTEQNSFFGPILPLLALLVVVRLWRRPLVRALAACGLLFASLSLGATVVVNRRDTGLPGPYRLLADVPLLDLVVPARFALVCAPVLGALLALALDRVSGGDVRRWAPWAGAVAVALLPLTPTPIRTVPVPPVPAVVAGGGWQAYVPPGRTLVPVPPVTGAAKSPAMFWSARTRLAFDAPGGYFIGPRSATDPTARWGAPDRPTSRLLRRAAETGQVPAIGDVERRQAVADLRHWRAAALVQADSTAGDPVRATLDALLGPGRDVAGGHLWDVRPLLG